MPKKKFFALMAAIILALSPLANAGAFNSATAQSYLQSHQGGSPWVTMALSSLGVSNLNTDYLKNIIETSAIKYEAPILAISSLGQDPRTFGSVNYVDKLKTFYSAGQIGEPATLNDDIFGILALTSAGVSASDSAVSGSKNFLLSHQNIDGGWGFVTPGDSGSDMTAAGIIALLSAGVASSDSHIQSAVNFIKTAQNNDGGFTDNPTSVWGTASDSSHTAWAIWAINALSSPMSSWSKAGLTPVDYLNSNQDQSGFFKFQTQSPADALSPDLTGQAVIALTGKTLPLKIITAASQKTVNFRIEGSAASVCSGNVAALTAMDVVKNAATACGYTYNIQSTSLGPYLNQINSDTASGQTGWLYLANNVDPSIGAADYQVQNGDSILWYFGNSGQKPLKLELSAAAINSGQSAIATVQSFSSSSFSALAGASVLFGISTSTTTQDGTASVAAPDGYYKVYAEKTGFTRSNSILLKVGQPSSSNVSLNADFSGGQIKGTSTPPSLGVSFTVDTSSLDFGSVTPGSQKNKTFTVLNNGSSNFKLSGSLSGDPLFTGSLSLNNVFWQNFAATINSGQNKTITAGLNVPNNFSANAGAKSGQLILWATSQ